MLASPPFSTAHVELRFAQGWEAVNAIIERKVRLLETAHRHVRLGLDVTELYKTVTVLDEAEEAIRHAFGIVAVPEQPPGVLTEEWGL